MPWATPIAWMLRGAIADREGRATEAQSQLTRAADAFDQADMQLYAAAARRRLAPIAGGDRGRDLQHQADTCMAAQNVAKPARLTALLTPGFRE
jgi:hypothetical protein